MQWDYFIWFALVSVICWSIASYLAFNPDNYLKSIAITLIGLFIFSLFIAGMWISLERPPLRTMGETRLWYSFFLPAAGLITFIRWKYKWILSISTIMSVVFISINLLHPEIHNKTLMPALQSPWFAPHVIVYMMAYAVFGVAAINAFFLLIKSGKSGKSGKWGKWGKLGKTEEPKEPKEPEKQFTSLLLCDNLVYVGTAFLTIGMLFGAIWAKEAWGHYWSWDPKETWAAATWMAFLLYLHFRLHRPAERKIALSLIIISFIILQICWFGVNYLPSAKEVSVHVYN